MSDAVNHPSHYTSHPSGIECIQITEAMNFNIGNAVKYLWRAGLKSDDPREDLLKARWYADRELARIAGVMPVAAPVEAPAARVFNVGDPEPADKETLTVRGVGDYLGTGAPTFKYGGSHSNIRDSLAGSHAWWAVSVPRDDRTNANWSYWLKHFGPLTEVL